MEELSKEKLALAHLTNEHLTQHKRHLAVMSEATGGSLEDDLNFLSNIAHETEDAELAFKCISKKVDAKLKVLDQLAKTDDPKIAVNVNTGNQAQSQGTSFDLEDIDYD